MRTWKHAAFMLLLSITMLRPFMALAQPAAEANYIESDKSLAEASRQGLKELDVEKSIEHARARAAESTTLNGYTIVGRSRDGRMNTRSIGLENGASITMLKGTETGQQLCLVITDGQGHTVIVDGGQKTHAPFLGRYIKANNGGKVDAWLLTHPHSDHVGALAVLLERQKSGELSDFANISLGEIYHNLAPLEFYRNNEESHRLPMIEEIFRDIAYYDQSKVHSDIPGGTIIDIGGIHIEVMNSVYQIPIDPGNNSSIVYKITVGGKTLLATGDLPYEAAEQLMQDRGLEALKSDILQMPHHGQHGGSEAFFRAVNPDYVLWPTHSELWARRDDAFDVNQQTYTIALTKHWIDGLSVKENFIMADGDWTLN